MPADFFYPNRTPEFWRPIALNTANATRGGHFLGVLARLKADVSIEQAGAEMKGIAERLSAQYPEAGANESAEVVALHEQIVGNIRPALITLLVAVGVVVLIACANVANLLLVRASVREKEVAIRMALGAGRQRLVFQMLAESVVLALVGGVLGLGLTYLAIPAIQSLSAGSIPRVAEVTLDTSVMLFALAVSVTTGVIFGLVPAFQSARAGTAGALKDGGRSSVGSGSRWMRQGLLVGEVALSLVLLVGAALLLRSFSRLTDVDPGFTPEGVLAFQVSLPQPAYPQDSNRLVFYDTLLERLSASPGITHAGAVQTLPMRGSYVLSIEFPSRPPAPPGDEGSANHRVVTPDYFGTLEIPLLRGRNFTSQDSADSPPVVIIDQAFVNMHFRDDDPMGQRINIGNGTDGAEIIGVVGTVSYSGLDAVAAPTMYVPLAQDSFSTMWVMARTDGDPNALTSTVRRVLGDIDRTLPAYAVTALTTVLEDSVAQRRFSMLLIMLFGGVALFLASVGLYGVVAYTVSLRTKEIGLRMAIGAQPRDVLTMILGGGMKLTVIGIGLGVVGALAASRYVESMLFEVEASDPVSYAATAALLMVIAALACYIPARRAMKVDPMITLQE
jgi:putative ABC transport system permease protein